MYLLIFIAFLMSLVSFFSHLVYSPYVFSFFLLDVLKIMTFLTKTYIENQQWMNDPLSRPLTELNANILYTWSTGMAFPFLITGSCH